MNTNWEFFKEKGNEEYKKKNYLTAIDLYSKGLAQDPQQDVLYSNRGLCYLAMRKTKQALYDFKKCVEVNPKNTKALRKLALIQTEYGNLGDAEQLLQKCVNLDRNDNSHKEELNNVRNLVTKYEQVNQLYQEKKDLKACEELAQYVASKCCLNENIKRIYIECLILNMKYKEAINYINQNVSDEEREMTNEYTYLKALTYYHEGEYEKAKVELRTLVQLDPNDERIKKLFKILNVIEKEKKQANDLFQKADYEAAFQAYSKLLELDPENNNFNSLILANRALCLQKKGKFVEALTDINQSIKLNEKYTKAYLRRGHINRDLGNFDEARYDYEKVKQLDPTNREVYNLIETCKSEAKKAKKKDYYKILEIPNTATPDEIKKAYRKLAPRYHPDKNRGSEEQMKNAEKMFRDVTEAYQVLSDPKKKQMYDSGINPEDPESGMGGEGMNIDPTEIFKMFFGGGGGQGFSGFGDGGHEFVFNMGGQGNGGRGGAGNIFTMFEGGNPFGGFGGAGGDPFSGFGFSSGGSRGGRGGKKGKHGFNF